MTFRYCQLARGRRFPVDREINWESISAIVPVGADGSEIRCRTEMDEMLLWSRQVISYEIRDSVMYATLGERK